MVSPYEAGLRAANQGARGVREARDSNAIESILSQAMSTGDPAVIQNSIGQILSQVSPERQGTALQYLQNTYQNLEKNKMRQLEQQAAQQAGYTYGAPPAVQSQQVKDRGKQDRIGQYYGRQRQPNGLQPMQGGAQPSGIPEQSLAQPDQSNPFARMTEDQLIQATGHPDREVSEPAKAQLKKINDDRKANASHFEPEADKLEAKRVSELADDIEKEYASTREENMRLDRQLKLDKEGNVSTPGLVKLLDFFGIPLGVLANPATEEYRKLESDFVRNVSKIFPGGKITNYEISSYLKTIPSLMNSPEGRKAIIRNRKLLNQAKEVRYDAYKKILKDNKGRKPQNLGVLIEEATAEKMAKIEDEFVNDVQDQLNKFETPIRMYDPEGNALDIPPSQIEAAMTAGAKFR